MRGVWRRESRCESDETGAGIDQAGESIFWNLKNTRETRVMGLLMWRKRDLVAELLDACSALVVELNRTMSSSAGHPPLTRRMYFILALPWTGRVRIARQMQP